MQLNLLETTKYDNDNLFSNQKIINSNKRKFKLIKRNFKNHIGDTPIDKNANYSFKRLAREHETSWNDIVERFISELIARNCRTKKEDLEWLLYNYYALPNSPALLTSGNEKFYASACSSYPITDSMDEGTFSILETLKTSTMATKAGIGTGFDFSNLRSKEETVDGRKNVTGGPVSFLRAYNGFIREITQATRKSASMGLLHINHPDIIEYINCKKIDGDIEGFNLSVVIDDKFMKAVEEDAEYELRYKKSEQTKKIKAKDLFKVMAERIWDNGEPGVMFEDTIKNDYFEDEINILANPCSEALLSHGKDWLELCVLASINLPKYIELNDADKQKVVSVTVTMLNDIIDSQDYVTELQRKGMQDRNRKIGIGVAGLATVLAQKNIKYSSSDAYNFTKDLFSDIGIYANSASKALGSIQVIINNKKQSLGRYNASLLSVAPTSTLSNIFDAINAQGCSFGIEPYFSLEPVKIHNSYGDFEKKEKIIDYLKGKIDHIECANDLDYKAHLSLVEAYYNSNPKGIVQGCSKTVNFKNNITVEDVKEAIMYCWKHKIKAISFYRDGSRKNQVISVKSDTVELDINSRPTDIVYLSSPKRPKKLPCDIYHTSNQKQEWLVLVGLLNNKPYEIFAGLEEKINIPKKYKHGFIEKLDGSYCLVLGDTDNEEDKWVIKDIPALFENKQFATITRLASMSLRHGTPLKFACEQLQRDGGFDAFNKAVARVLKKYIKEDEESSLNCEKCGLKMRYVQGCLTCDCGYTKCG